MPLFVTDANASESKAEDNKKAPEVPELAFLEFLADMQEVDGKLLSPSDLLDLPEEQSAQEVKSNIHEQGKPVLSEEQLVILELLNQFSPENQQQQQQQQQQKQKLQQNQNPSEKSDTTKEEDNNE